MQKKWYRSRTDKMIAGICGGLGEYFDVDPTIVRLLFVVGIFMGGAAVLAYVILWIIVPGQPYVVPEKKDEQEPESGSSDTEEKGESQGESSGSAGETETRDKKENPYKRNRTGIFGGILIIIGVLLLIDNFVRFEAFWPLLLIILGAAILLNARRD